MSHLTLAHSAATVEGSTRIDPALVAKLVSDMKEIPVTLEDSLQYGIKKLYGGGPGALVTLIRRTDPSVVTATGRMRESREDMLARHYAAVTVAMAGKAHDVRPRTHMLDQDFSWIEARILAHAEREAGDDTYESDMELVKTNFRLAVEEMSEQLQINKGAAAHMIYRQAIDNSRFYFTSIPFLGEYIRPRLDVAVAYFALRLLTKDRCGRLRCLGPAQR